MKTLKDIFLDELADMYDAERRIAKASTKMAKVATSSSLKDALLSLVNETDGQLKKLERIFQSFNKPAKGRKCQATVGILDEGAAIARQCKGSPAINAALVLVMQKLKHHEIASYDCLREWAALLGEKESAELLKQLRNEEKSATDLLSTLANSKCNPEALDVPAVTSNSRNSRNSFGKPARIRLPANPRRKLSARSSR